MTSISTSAASSPLICTCREFPNRFWHSIKAKFSSRLLSGIRLKSPDTPKETNKKSNKFKRDSGKNWVATIDHLWHWLPIKNYYLVARLHKQQITD